LLKLGQRELVVRHPASGQLPGLVPNAQGRQKLQGLAQIAGVLRAQALAVGRGSQAVLRIDLGVPTGQGIDARQVHDGHDALVLEVHHIAQLAVAVRGDAAEHAQGRAVSEGVGGQPGQEDALVARRLQHLGPQLVEQAGLAMHQPQVEEDTGQHQRGGVGRVDPGVEVVRPLRLRLAPLGVAGHHVARAAHIAAVVQAIVHEPGQRLEMLPMPGRVVPGVEHQAVVLVALGGLLAARL
jgi:hypothetical protein